MPTTSNLPAEGWGTKYGDRPTWTSHNPFDRPPQLPGYTPWFIARHGQYVTYTYRPV